MRFPIGAPLEPAPYRQRISRYYAIQMYRGYDLDLSRPDDDFIIIHLSGRDRWTRSMWFPIDAPAIVTNRTVFSRYAYIMSGSRPWL